MHRAWLCPEPPRKAAAVGSPGLPRPDLCYSSQPARWRGPVTQHVGVGRASCLPAQEADHTDSTFTSGTSSKDVEPHKAPPHSANSRWQPHVKQTDSICPLGPEDCFVLVLWPSHIIAGRSPEARHSPWRSFFISSKPTRSGRADV